MTYLGPGPGGGNRHDVLDFGSERPPRRPWLTPVLLAVVIVAAGIVVVSQSGGQHHRGRILPPPVAVTTAGHRLLGVRGGWQLFARGPDSVVAIDLAAGRITITRVPELGSASPEVAFIVGPHNVIIRSFDEVPAYVVPDGAPVRPLTGVLARDEPGPMLPGPGPGLSWVMTVKVHLPSLVLIGPDGRPTGASIRLPPDAPLPATAVPDGRGGVLLLTSNNEVYDASAARYWRVPAEIIAVGPTRWLGITCRGLRCNDSAIDPATTAERALPAAALPPEPAFSWLSLGVTSPDGRFAAVPGYDGSRLILDLVSLSSGARLQVAVQLSTYSSYQVMAWSPDSQWLFVAAADGRLLAISARTGKATGLGVRLPPVTQVAVRAGPGSGG